MVSSSLVFSKNKNSENLNWLICKDLNTNFFHAGSIDQLSFDVGIILHLSLNHDDGDWLNISRVDIGN